MTVERPQWNVPRVLADERLIDTIRAAMPEARTISGPDDPPHWACPDCGAPCYCVDPVVRSMPHQPCNVPEAAAA